jgi:uncharacterized protein YijF (DUF1287 family)
MKKIAYLLSALSAALFSTAANADVSVGGSASLAYSGASGNTTILQGGAVSFGLSTTTDSGMTISSSAGITRDTDAAGSATATGLSSLTLATGGATIKIGYDIGLADGTAAVGEIVTVADHNSNGVTNTGGMGDDEGAGISLSTTFGDAAVSVVYVYDKATSTNTSGDLDGAANTGTSVSVTLPMGPASVTGTYVSGDVSNTTDTESALTASYATDAGTFKVGYASFDGDTTSINGTTFGLSYAMDFDGTSVKLGYQSYDVNSTSGNSTDVVVSRPLGGGASLFAEMRSTGGTVGTTSTKSTSTIAVGTSVSF